MKESRSLQERMCGLCELSLQKNHVVSVWEESGKWEKSGSWSGCPIYFEASLVVFCRSFSPCLLVHVYPGLKAHAGHSDWLRGWKLMQADGPEDLCFLFDVRVLLDLDREVWDGVSGFLLKPVYGQNPVSLGTPSVIFLLDGSNSRQGAT